jgi:quinol monooxygenase YgiN
MNSDNIALFIRHKAKPGRRDDVKRIWENYVKPRAAANPDHLEYFFCYDETDSDAISVFQLYQNRKAMTLFLSGEWYQKYLSEIAQVISEAPQILSAAVVWQKNQQE